MPVMAGRVMRLLYHVDGTFPAIHVSANPGGRMALISMFHGIGGCLSDHGLQVSMRSGEQPNICAKEAKHAMAIRS